MKTYSTVAAAKKIRSNEIEMLLLPLDKFTWEQEQQVLVAEMSDFGPMRDGRWWLQRIYNDACDVGIAIRSHHTGRVEKFVLSGEDNYEGEVQGLRFTPLNKSCRIKEVLLIND